MLKQKFGLDVTTIFNLLKNSLWAVFRHSFFFAGSYSPKLKRIPITSRENPILYADLKIG